MADIFKIKMHEVTKAVRIRHRRQTNWLPCTKASLRITSSLSLGIGELPPIGKRRCEMRTEVL
jgi:hypothetical protein